MDEQKLWPPEPHSPPGEPATLPQHGRNAKRGLVLALAGCGVGAGALTLEGLLLQGFWHDAQALAPGTPIRPMGLTLAMGVVGAGAFFLGCPLSGMGLVFGVKSRSWRVALIGIAGLCLCLSPMPVASELFQYLAGAKGLYLEP